MGRDSFSDLIELLKALSRQIEIDKKRDIFMKYPEQRIRSIRHKWWRLLVGSFIISLTSCANNDDDSCVPVLDNLKQAEIVEDIVRAYSKGTTMKNARARIEGDMMNTNVSFYDCSAHFRMVSTTGKTPTGYALDYGVIYELEKDSNNLILWEN